jgi:hypothetical protein
MKPQPAMDQIVQDIRSDLIDSEIMQKYGISAKELQEIYQELLKSNSVELAELYCRPVLWDNSVSSEHQREFPRLLLAFVLPVHDASNPEIRGIVGDLTERGMKLEGILAEVGEKRRFVVNPSKLGQMEPIAFEAECRWMTREGQDERPVGGFQITKISDNALGQLRNFISFLTTGRERKQEPPLLKREEEREDSAQEAFPLPDSKLPTIEDATPVLKKPVFRVSFNLNCPDTYRDKLSELIGTELQKIPDVAITEEEKSMFHIAIFAVEVEPRLFCSVAITRTIWTDVEFCIRRALLDMWERMSDKAKDGLLYRGAVINEVLTKIGHDYSLKGIQDHWPMVVTPDSLDKACEKIIAYLDSKFLEVRRRKRK